jgi:5-methylcytosine-specific restriction endonuclease McrA
VKTHSCSISKYHYPRVVDTDLHHIIPREYKGPTIPENLVEVCNNCHRAIHEYIDATLGLKPVPKVSKAQRKYAEKGLKGLWYGVQ